VLLIEVEVGSAFLDVHQRQSGSALHAQLTKFHDCVGSQAGGAAVFKLDFYLAIIARPQTGALDDWHVEKCAIESVAITAVDLNITFDVAQAHDSDLRISKCGNR
jgi:hypothetical protein